ncbi:PTS sugar transporter subunit IIB [Peptacetobacter sp.]|uniref:PTS sugar transporter subunit IIB n=1 Tax=Peptacetobacter sp. TaxID=2991975 RepID=UPI0026098324|nr:PTS sugar transporter subunit IIB [Peptacetobacter sp.]
MKILLVCGAGMSTSVLMGKVRKWAAANGEDIVIEATGQNNYESEWHKYDCILTGPQIAYKLNEIKETVSIPVAQVPAMDYAMGNAANVVKLAHDITGK